MTKVFYEGPGWKAGVKKDDVLIEVDGRKTQGKELNTIVEELRGEEGTDVTIVVQQPNAEPRLLTITRGVTFIPTIEGQREIAPGQWQYTVGQSNDVGYLRFRGFGPSTLHELREIASQLRQEEIQSFVLDLRSGAARLHDVIMVADALLDGGVIGHVRYLDSVQTHEAQPGNLFPALPMALLVNDQSGAGEVFLAAALQDHARAIVVGEPNSGDTFVRAPVPVPGEDAQIILAIGILHRGSGTPLNLMRDHHYRLPRVEVETATDRETERASRNDRVVYPDHFVSMGRKEKEQAYLGTLGERDRMLSKAIEVLQSAGEQEQGQEKTSSGPKAMLR